jgi:Fic family protein
LNHGIERLSELPLSNRLLKEIHEVLMAGTQGGHRRVGEFRRSQNWIGPPGSTIEDATFVPPPVPEMTRAMGELETWLHEDRETPILVKCGLAHYQFETIHPFEDGNGRVGRLLVTLMLVEREVLVRPLLYLSAYLKRHRAAYYDWLTRVRTHGDFEGWLKFFLTGVRDVSLEATETARRVLTMRQDHQELVRSRSGSRYAIALLEELMRSPAITPRSASRRLGVSYQTANKLIAEFEAMELLEEITGAQRNRVFVYRPYIDRLGGPLEP